MFQTFPVAQGVGLEQLRAILLAPVPFCFPVVCLTHTTQLRLLEAGLYTSRKSHLTGL